MDQLATPRAPTQSMPDSTPITDFALIESQKENIRPHAAGRSAATLSNLFVKSEADRVIQEGHAQHMKDVEEAERRDREGEDMVDGFVDLLDVYSRCVTLDYPEARGARPGCGPAPGLRAHLQIHHFHCAASPLFGQLALAASAREHKSTIH